MKAYIFFMFLLTVLLISCNTEETVISEQDTIQLINTTETQSRAPGSGLPCEARTCDPNFAFLGSIFSPRIIEVFYQTTYTEEQIHCLRYEYFQCFPYLLLAVDQNPDPYIDRWSFEGRPDDEVTTTVCNDPRLLEGSCD